MQCQSLKRWRLILNDWKGWGQSLICLLLLVLLGSLSGSLWLARVRCGCCSPRSPSPAVGPSRPSRPLLCKRIFRRNEEPPRAPMAAEARCWERAVSTAFPKLLTLGWGDGGRGGPAAGKTRRGIAAGGTRERQIRRGKRALSSPSCKQKDHAENAAVLMWLTAERAQCCCCLCLSKDGYRLALF